MGGELRAARRDKHAVGVRFGSRTLTQTSESIRTRGVFHGCRQDEAGEFIEMFRTGPGHR